MDMKNSSEDSSVEVFAICEKYYQVRHGVFDIIKVNFKKKIVHQNLVFQNIGNL